MPERMRLIRNRAEVIYCRDSNWLAGECQADVRISFKDNAIPLDVRQHYYDLAERELVAEGKINRSSARISDARRSH